MCFILFVLIWMTSQLKRRTVTNLEQSWNLERIPIIIMIEKKIQFLCSLFYVTYFSQSKNKRVYYPKWSALWTNLIFSHYEVKAFNEFGVVYKAHNLLFHNKYITWDVLSSFSRVFLFPTKSTKAEELYKTSSSCGFGAKKP